MPGPPNRAAKLPVCATARCRMRLGITALEVLDARDFGEPNNLENGDGSCSWGDTSIQSLPTRTFPGRPHGFFLG